MDIHVYSKNQRYHFVAGSFLSERDYYLFPGVKSSYSTAWRAEYDARQILKKPMVLSQSSADQETDSPESDSSSMLRNHYMGAYDEIKKSAELTKDDKEKREQVYGALKMLVENILKINQSMDDEEDSKFFNQLINKLSSLAKDLFSDLLNKDSAEKPDEPAALPPMPDASQGAPMGMPPLGAKSVAIVRSAIAKRTLELNDVELGELMEHYATQACHALEKEYPDTIYVLYPENRTIVLGNVKGDKPFLRMAINQKYLVDLIAPQEDFVQADSKHFYQHCWRPIVDALGHFDCGDAIIVQGVSSLPDVSSSTAEYPVLCASASGHVLRTVVFGDKSWHLCQAVKVDLPDIKPSRYTELDYQNNGRAVVVECIDVTLADLCGRSGLVKQVIPFPDHVEADIDFGNHIIRLTEQQYKIIPK